MKKMLSFIALALILGGTLALGGMKTTAAAQSMWFWGNRNDMFRMRGIERGFIGQNRVSFFNDNILSMRNRFFVRNISDNTNMPGRFANENIMISDRDTGNFFVIRNQNTGPFSFNRVVVRTDNNTFRRIFNNVSLQQDISINVDTGNNTVSFNTVVGDISTGDVSIMAQ